MTKNKNKKQFNLRKTNQFTPKFESDWNWFISVTHFFTFDGVKDYVNKSGKPVIKFSEHGCSAKEAFYLYDTQGKIIPTNEPELLYKILKVKGSINLHIKMYAEDRAKGLLPKFELQDLCKELNAPEWFYTTIEKYKFSFY